MTTVSAMLTAYRERTGITQQAIADRLGVTTTFVQYLLSGKRPPRKPEHVAALADLLSVDTDLIYTATGVVPPDLAERLAHDLESVKATRQAINQPLPE